MKTVKAAKRERRANRKARDRRRDGPEFDLRTFGSMDREIMGALQAALDSIDLGAPWSSIAPLVLPVIKRVRQPFAVIEPLYITVPPGIRAGFGVDVGPAFSHITTAMAEQWGVSGATLLGTALENLQRIALREPPHVERFQAGGVALTAIQGQGWGSSLILAPDMLRPILGPEAHVLMTPVRNTLLALPGSTTLDDLASIYLAVTDGAHDALDAQILRWNGQAVVDLNDHSVGLPN